MNEYCTCIGTLHGDPSCEEHGVYTRDLTKKALPFVRTEIEGSSDQDVRLSEQKLPRQGTMVRQFLDYWQARPMQSIRFNDGVRYWQNMQVARYGGKPSAARHVSQNMLRILRKYGAKIGKNGDCTPWVFGRRPEAARKIVNDFIDREQIQDNLLTKTQEQIAQAQVDAYAQDMKVYRKTVLNDQLDEWKKDDVTNLKLQILEHDLAVTKFRAYLLAYCSTPEAWRKALKIDLMADFDKFFPYKPKGK